MQRRKIGGVWRTAVNLATVSPGSGTPTTQTLGGQIFDALYPSLLLLADGTPALTWDDRF